MALTVRTLLSAVFGLALAATAAPGQATLRGRVVDSELEKPIPGALVRVNKEGQVLRTDSLGQFVRPGLTGRSAEVTIRAIGFDSATFEVPMRDSGTVTGVFPLEFNGFDLPPIEIQARADALMPRYTDFERRRQRKMGAYLRWDEIKKQGYSTVGEALRRVKGVRIQCNQAEFECGAVMVGTPQCNPTWYIDGVEVHSFNENTPIHDVYGIEVYRGPGEIPAEFGGSNAACGVIVVWTKSRPYR